MKHSKNTSDGTNETSFQDRVFNTIEDMPIWNWIKVLETGKLEWIFIKGKGRVTKKLAEHWLVLQQQYIDEFGLDEGYKQKLRLMSRLNNLNLDFVLTRDRSLLNEITMIGIDLKASDTQQPISFYDLLDHVEKYKRFSLDPKNPKELSVIKWYHTLKNMSKNGKTQQNDFGTIFFCFLTF